MIVNISPYVKSFEDTHNTLVYANSCKNIKTHVIQNVYNEETIDYSKEITDLLEENKLLKDQLHQKFLKDNISSLDINTFSQKV